MKESTPGGNAGVDEQMRTSLGRRMIRIEAQEKPISDLVKGMGRLISQSMGEDVNDFASPKPRVIDKTGLTGKYDFTSEFSCERCSGLFGNLAMAAGGGPARRRLQRALAAAFPIFCRTGKTSRAQARKDDRRSASGHRRESRREGADRELIVQPREQIDLSGRFR